MKVRASEEGNILYFEDAVLARAETNKNGDELSLDNLKEVANTLPLLPVDDEHITQKVLGIFTDAKVEDNALVTAGMIYAGRFPEHANELAAGERHLSIEADAEIAICSVCGGEFGRGDDYCEHLRMSKAERMQQGIKRQFRNMRAVGGGLTKTPAGTDTRFNLDAIRMIASVDIDEDDKTFIVELDRVLRGYGFHILEG